MSILENMLPEDLKRGLTNAEKKLLGFAQLGKEVDFRSGDKETDKPENADRWEPGRTIRADFLYWLYANPEVSKKVHSKGVHVIGANIEGKLDLTAAFIEHPLSLVSCSIKQNILLFSTEAHRLVFSESLIGSLLADGLSTKSDVFLDNVRTKGEVSLSSANIGGQLSCQGAIFENAEGTAFTGDGLFAKAGIFFDNMLAKGEVRLVSANIGSQLSCLNATFEHEGGVAFAADGLSVKGIATLQKMHAKGEVSFAGANIAGQLLCHDAILENPGGRAFHGDSLFVKADIFFDNVCARGEVRLPGANIGGQLSFRAVTFENAEGLALALDNAKITGEFSFLNAKKVNGELSFKYAQIGQLEDDKTSWPATGNLYLDGFEYKSFGGDANIPKTPIERLTWLRLQPKQYFRLQPYEQLAKVFRQIGHEKDARTVLIEKQNDLRKYGFLSNRARLWNWFLGVTIGHGYQPGKVILKFILPILTLGAIIFCWAETLNVMQPSKERVYMDSGYVKIHALPPEYPRFSPIAYSVDVFVPFANLHQEDYWLPSVTKPYGNWFRLYLWLHISLGWIFSTLAVASLTGLIRKE